MPQTQYRHLLTKAVILNYRRLIQNNNSISWCELCVNETAAELIYAGHSLVMVGRGSCLVSTVVLLLLVDTNLLCQIKNMEIYAFQYHPHTVLQRW